MHLGQGRATKPWVRWIYCIGIQVLWVLGLAGCPSPTSSGDRLPTTRIIGLVSSRSAIETAEGAKAFIAAHPGAAVILRTPEQLAAQADLDVQRLWEGADALLLLGMSGEIVPRLERLLDAAPPPPQATVLALSGDPRLLSRTRLDNIAVFAGLSEAEVTAVTHDVSAARDPAQHVGRWWPAFPGKRRGCKPMRIAMREEWRTSRGCCVGWRRDTQTVLGGAAGRSPWTTIEALGAKQLDLGVAVRERAWGLRKLEHGGDLHPTEALARRRIDRADILARIGPMLGLMGTLIPLGPGLAALGRGEVTVLAQAVTVAFDSTVLGLMIGVLAFAVGRLRRRWYHALLDTLEKRYA